MTKKKSKAAARKAPKKSGRKLTARRAAGAAPPNGGPPRTVYATVMIFEAGGSTLIRTTPQRVYANPGDRVQWSVVNLVNGSDPEVTLTWPSGGPFGGNPIRFRGHDSRVVPGGAAGRAKYVVSALGVQEDPEVEIPDI